MNFNVLKNKYQNDRGSYRVNLLLKQKIKGVYQKIVRFNLVELEPFNEGIFEDYFIKNLPCLVSSFRKGY
jgi:hypothetical protein